MEIYILENSIKANLMDTGNIIGQMEAITRETFLKEKETDMEYGKDQLVIATSTKESTYRIEKKDMAFLLGTQETSIRAITTMMKEMDMEKCTGLMEVITKVIGIKGCKKAKVIAKNIIGTIYTIE